jgi:hypothetical protein
LEESRSGLRISLWMHTTGITMQSSSRRWIKSGALTTRELRVRESCVACLPSCFVRVFCANTRRAYQFIPVPVANLTYGGISATWSNTGCFASNTATVAFNASGATITITGKSPKGLCSDVFLVMTSYSIIAIEVSALRPTGTGGFKSWKANELQDIKVRYGELLHFSGKYGTENDSFPTTVALRLFAEQWV